MRTRITILGMHPLWPEILASGLSSRFADQLEVSSFVQGAGIGSIPAFMRHLGTADLIVRVGVTLDPASRLDRLFMDTPRWRRKRCCALFWIGTDVLRFTQGVSAGTLDPRVIDVVRTMPSLAGADHLAAELKAVGVDAVPVPFPAPVLAAPAEAPPMPARFRVLTYLPSGSGERFSFYGGEQIVAAARALPEIEFAVMGADALDVAALPPNVMVLGHVTTPGPQYAASSAVVRMVEHDAIGGTVMEGLLYARHVIYSVPLPHTTTVTFGDTDGLIGALRGLAAASAAGTLRPNHEGRAWALEEFDPERRFAHLRDVVLELAATTRPASA